MPKLLERVGRPPVGKITVHSAINPMLWLCALTPICYSAAYVLSSFEPAMYLLLSIGSLPIIIACVAFGYFARNHPEKLQSEDYQLRHEAMQLIRQKGTAIEIDASTLDAITNPVPDVLPSSAGDAK